MSDQQTSGGGRAARASFRQTRFPLVWLLPAVVVVLAVYLAWKGIASRGPEITITFDTADGIVAGQTQLKNKSVVLGTVSSVQLAKDLRNVDVKVQMRSDAAPLITDQARFWVVRPRINGTSITGLSTLMSGAYIAIDPGNRKKGHKTTTFKGLDMPPGVRSDQPGHIYVLEADSVESVGPGAPVFFRDMQVGEVLDYTMPPGGVGKIPIRVFVRDPFDRYLRSDTRFWNVSGLKVAMGGAGLQIQMQSLQALLSGGIAFGIFNQTSGRQDGQVVPSGSVFKLYNSREEAAIAGYHHRLYLVTYVSSSVQGLSKGSKVALFGQQVGNVSSVDLDMGHRGDKPRVRIGFDIQPERVLKDPAQYGELPDMVSLLVAHGLYASVESESLLTGTSMIALNFTTKKTHPQAYREGPCLVVPSQPGGMGGMMASAASVVDKVASIPLDEIGKNLNNLLAHTDQRINSADVKKSLHALQGSLQHLQHIAGTGASSLPKLSAELDKTLKNANALLGSYGGDTDFHHNLQKMVEQLNQTARSLRLLTDFVRNHPSSLITGR